MSRSKDQITSGLLVCLLLFAVIGCGGSPKQPAPILPPENGNSAAPAGPVSPAVGAAGNAPKTDEKPNSEKKEGEDTEPPGPDDYVLSTDQLVTVVENSKPKPPPAPFEVSPAAKGIDSSNLVLVAAAATQTPGTDTTSFQATPPMIPANTADAGNAAAVKPKSPNAAGQDAAEGEPWSLPTGFVEVPGSPVDAETGLPLRIRGERDPVDMVLIPPGAFFRGADVADPTVSPRHTVLMEAPYYIDTVEVSVGRYAAFREHYRKTEGRKFDPSINHDGNPEYPAVGIKFFDAKFYAKWASKELPTESQWERAARGDQGHNYPWGDGRAIFQLPRIPGQITQVANFPGDRSPFGVYDMAGNAREWCLDLYQADIYQKEIASGGGTVRNPVGPKAAPGIKQQVIRGSHDDWAIWHRTPVPPTDTAPDIGFRCVLNLTHPSKEKSEKPDKSGTKKPEAKKKTAGPKF